MKNEEKALYLYVGIRLRRKRQDLGASQRDVADAVGLKQNSISNIEAGKQRFLLDQLFGMCRFLKLEPRSILPTTKQLTTNPPKHIVPIGGDLVELTIKEADESVRKLDRLLGKKRKQEL